MTTPGDDFLKGIDPMSAARADVEADVAIRVDELLGDVENWKPEGLGPLLEALGGPTSGYREIASAEGIHWHERIDEGEDDDDPR